jgi:hypothetical protein
MKSLAKGQSRLSAFARENLSQSGFGLKVSSDQIILSGKK